MTLKYPFLSPKAREPDLDSVRTDKDGSKEAMAMESPNDRELGLARSLEFSGLGLSVFWHVRTGFRFGLFQSLIVYKIESYHLQFRDRRG